METESIARLPQMCLSHELRVEGEISVHLTKQFGSGLVCKDEKLPWVQSLKRAVSSGAARARASVTPRPCYPLCSAAR